MNDVNELNINQDSNADHSSDSDLNFWEWVKKQ